MQNQFPTPFELGNGNQTTTWQACMAWYENLARHFPAILRLEQIGESDNGKPILAGVITADGVFDRATLQAEGRLVFFNNNGIHPGEPEGIDACMALVRDFCTQPERLARLGKAVFLFIPVYNVDGSLNRANTSRVNQDGPEAFGFRGCARHLDLNRDFIKCDSRNAQVFNRFFAAWSPDVMVDTHTSNGADYSYTMTLIHTQADKLGGELGAFLRDSMLPALFADMDKRGWPMCPYVNPIEDTPDHGIAEFLETPRFSTGFAALHHTIGFMPETHMLKPYADRYASMRALVEAALDFSLAHGADIQALRAAARAADHARRAWDIHWAMDASQPASFRFKGYTARYSPSKLGNYTRLAYDRSAPWEKVIPYFNRFVADVRVSTPRAYLLPQAWREVIERLEWNGVACERLQADTWLEGQAWQVRAVTARPGPYEGHMFHDHVDLERQSVRVLAQAGDVLVHLDRGAARYAVETLEPQAHDSFFRWGFFNSVLEKKEAYSDYVFEDHAAELLASEPELAAAFAAWKAAHPDKLSDQRAVLDFIFTHCARYREPEWRRYPVIALA